MTEEALLLSQSIGDLQREMQCLHTITNQRIFLGQPSWQESGEKALELARSANNPSWQAPILITLGTAYAWSDQPERGMRYLTAALPICEEIGDKIAMIDLLSQLGLKEERNGEYVRLLRDFAEKQLKLSLDIGYRQGEINALYDLGQTQAIYLGDFEGGLTWLEAARQRSVGHNPIMLADLRLVQVQIASGDMDSARQTVDFLLQMDETNLDHYTRAGIRLVAAELYNSLNCNDTDLHKVIQLTQETEALMATNPMISQQYAIAAGCHSAIAYLRLSQCTSRAADIAEYQHQALLASQHAFDLYSSIGYMQIIECTSENVLFTHYLALTAAKQENEAQLFLLRAYQEMMRKVDLIPMDSEFRTTYLQQIPLHRQIAQEYTQQQSRVRIA
ncbi:MAG: hypothetical protein AB6733_07145 [Clostridiaceae bacterium]